MPRLRLKTSVFQSSIVYATPRGSARVVAYMDHTTYQFVAVEFLRKQLGHDQRNRLIGALRGGQTKFRFKSPDEQPLTRSEMDTSIVGSIGFSCPHSNYSISVERQEEGVVVLRVVIERDGRREVWHPRLTAPVGFSIPLEELRRE